MSRRINGKRLRSRIANRQLHLEHLEDRRLLAIGFDPPVLLGPGDAASLGPNDPPSSELATACPDAPAAAGRWNSRLFGSFGVVAASTAGDRLPTGLRSAPSEAATGPRLGGQVRLNIPSEFLAPTNLP